MKQLKQILLWVIIVLVVAVVINYALSYFMSGGPYLEGFSYSTAVPLADGKDAITGLYFMKNNVALTDILLNAALVELSNICPASATTMTKACFDGLVTKYSLDKSMEVSSATGINAGSAKKIISVLNRQLGTSYSTLDADDVGYAMTDDADLSRVCAVSATGTITRACYKKLYDKFVTNATPAPATVKDDLDADGDEDDIKDRRVELFMTLAETVGYDDVKEKNVRNSYDDMTKSCGKKSSSYDRACYEDIAADLKLTLFSGSKDTSDTSTKSSTDKKSTTSSITDSLFPKSDVSGGSYNAKCTVEFGKDVVNPQTKAATTKAPDSTCTTTGDVSKTTKTPAVEQGCEFTQKFPKVNVINLRDYVHKDEVPCWSCKL